MKFNKLWFGLLSIPLLFTSCIPEGLTPTETNYTYQIYNSDLIQFVKCVHFSTETVGYVGNNEGILKSTDNGITWKSVAKTSLPINSIYFVNTNLGYAVGGKLKEESEGTALGSNIFKTTDAGANWTKQTIPVKDSELNSVCFINENIGFAVGYKLHLKTIDGGKTWTEFTIDYTGRMNKISFVNDQTGFIAGTNGNIFKTTDQGATWTKTNTGKQEHFYDLNFISPEIGFAAGKTQLYKSIDGGDTWTTIVLPGSPVELKYCHFINEQSGVVLGVVPDLLGKTHAIYCTLDGGKTWTEEYVNYDPIVHFPTKNTGYSVMTGSTVKFSVK